MLTTHLMDEAEELADQVVVVDHGLVIAHGSVRSLVSSAQDQTLRLETTPRLDLRAALGEQFVVTEPRDGSYTVTGAVDPDAVAALTAWLAAHGALATRLTVGRRTLEDVFLDLTGRNLR